MKPSLVQRHIRIRLSKTLEGPEHRERNISGELRQLKQNPWDTQHVTLNGTLHTRTM